MAMPHLPATRRMFSMIRSNVPWPPRSGRMRLCVSRSPSSVIFTPRSPNGSMRSTTLRCSSRPLVMMLIATGVPRAVDACHSRSDRSYITGRFSSGSPPKNISMNRSGRTRSSSRFDPVADPAGRLERHLLGELVVVAVVALEAVVAREVALERRQQRDVQLGGVALDRGEVLVERLPIVLAARRPGSRSPRAPRPLRAIDRVGRASAVDAVRTDRAGSPRPTTPRAARRSACSSGTLRPAPAAAHAG